jgi:hypothetical protein
MSYPFLRTYLISFLFIGCIAFPFLNDRLGLVKDTPNLENRKLAGKPEFDLNYLDPYPAAFEKYYNDTFALRSRIMGFFNIYNCLILKKSPFPDKVIIGGNGWLYMVDNDISNDSAVEYLSTKELLTIKEELERRKTYLASKNCQLFVMVTPSKANVHPEHLPYAYRRQGIKTGRQLTAFLKKCSTLNMVDLYDWFGQTRSTEPLYYALDNHWNHLGAFHAANAAIHNMSASLPGLSPLALSDFRIVKTPRSLGNMKQMLGNLDVYTDTEYELQPLKGFKAVQGTRQNYPPPNDFPYPWEYEYEKEIPGSSGPKLLIFSDSFGSYVFPFLSENFSRTVKIFGGWNYTIDREIVEREKPDAVLLMIHEPLIRNLLRGLSK